MAFALEEYTTKETKGDPRFVKWIATYIEYEDNKAVETRSEFLHPCTDEEFLKFNPPDSRSVSRAKFYKENGGLFCLDWKQAGFKLWGASSDSDHTVIDVVALPCNVKATIFNATEDRIPEDCNWDRDAAINYIGDINIVAYYNQGRFMPNEFDESPVLSYSVV